MINKTEDKRLDKSTSKKPKGLEDSVWNKWNADKQAEFLKAFDTIAPSNRAAWLWAHNTIEYKKNNPRR